MKFSKHILQVILCTAAVLFVFLASTASAAFILKDTNKELGGYVRVGATHNITESKGANAYFTSSDSSIISITKSGKMTPLKAGQVSIASYTITGTKIASKTIIARVGATSIDLNYSKLYLPTGYDYTLRPQLLVSLTPADSTDHLSYDSSSSDIASVEIGSGKITAKANGAATITVYSKLTAATKNDDPSNVTASAKVYVHNHDGNGRYTAIDSFHHFRDCKGANCHFTSDISQRKYYGEHIFNSDKSAHIAAMRQKRLPGIRIRGSSQAIPGCIGMCAKTRTAERQRILKFTISARITNVRSAD